MNRGRGRSPRPRFTLNFEHGSGANSLEWVIFGLVLATLLLLLGLVAMRLAGEILSLPIFPAMRADQVERIGETAHAFFGAPRAGVTAAA